MTHTSVMKFGVHNFVDDESAAIVRAESEAAHRYYNNLLEIKLSERKAYRLIRSGCVPELDAVEKEIVAVSEQLDELFGSIKKERAKTRRKTSASDGELTAEVALRALRKELGEQAKKMRAHFASLLAPAEIEYDRRTTGAPVELLAQIAEIGKQLKSAKKTPGNSDVKALAITLASLKARKKEIAPKTYAKARANLSVWEAMRDEPGWSAAWKQTKALRMESHGKALALRAASTLFHGTYAAVEEAIDSALEDSVADPRFRRFDGGRKIGMQIQGGATVGALEGGQSAKAKIEWVDRVAGRKRYAVVSLRLGAKGDRWVKMAVKVHRPIPSDALITWIYLVPRKVGSRSTYSLQLTVNTDRPLIERAIGVGVATVRPKWSLAQVDGKITGVIVADINGKPLIMTGRAPTDNPGKHPVHVYEALDRVRALRSVVDALFEGDAKDPARGARTKLIDWMGENPELVPQWMTEMTQYVAAVDGARGRVGIAQWRRHDLLAAVATKWVASIAWLQQPVDEHGKTRITELWREWMASRDVVAAKFGAQRGDYHADNREVLDAWLADRGITDSVDRMAIWLDWWRRKDTHLTTWAADLQSRALGARKNQYRCVAARLAMEFERLEIHATDLAFAAKRKSPTADKDEANQQARYQRQIAAPSELIDALKNAFGKGRWTEIKPVKREGLDGAEKPLPARKTTLPAEIGPEPLGI